MARQFQGYARGRGFTSRSPGAGAVSRIQEQGNKTIQGLKEQLQSKRQQDQQYASELNSNFNRSQAIKGEIKQFEDKAFALKMSNIKQNQEQSLRNIEVEAEKQARVYEQLSKFAPTLGETIVDVKDAFDEANNKAAFANSIFNFDQLSSPPSDLDKAGEEQLFKANATAETSNQQSVKENGLPQSTAQAQNKQSHYRQLKNTDARIAALGRAFRARATFDNHGIGLLHDLIEEFGLYGVKQQRFYEVAQDISKIQAGFQAENRRVSAINTSSELVTTALNQLIDNPTISNARNFYQTLSTSTEDGRSALTRPQVLDRFFKALENTNLTHDQVELIMGMEMIDEYGNGIGETFLQRHGKAGPDGTSRYRTLLNNRAKARIDSVDLEKKKLDAENKQNFVQVMTALDKAGEQGPVDFYAYKPEIDGVSMSEDQRNKALEKLWEISKQGISNRPLINEIERLRSIGQDYTDVANKLQGKDRYKYLNLASQEIKERAEAGINDASDRRQIKDALVKALNQQNIGDDKDPSLHPALEDAMVDIGRNTVNNPQGASTLAGARKLAIELKLQEIKAGTGKYEVKGMAKGNSNSTDNYFTYYSPGGKYFTQVVKQNPSQLMTTVRNRPDIRKDTFLTTQDNLANYYNSISNNKPIQLDYALQQINKAYPDTLQLQLDKYAVQNNLPRVTVPLTQNQYLAANAEDPRLKQFALRMDTIEEEKIFPVAADESARSDPRFKSDAVNQHISFMQVAPADGGITGLTVQDYQELAYAVSAEAQRGTDDEFAVAASILNRLASGRYGSTVAEVIRAPGQYEAVYKGMARYEPQLAQRLASPDGQRMIVAMLQKLQGRTDFKGQTQLGYRDASDPMFSDRGNFYHYAGQSAGSGPYQGPIDTSYERFIN